MRQNIIDTIPAERVSSANMPHGLLSGYPFEMVTIPTEYATNADNASSMNRAVLSLA